MRSEGRRIFAAAFVLFIRPAPELTGECAGPPRVAVAVSRRVGSAVERNRVRRRLKELFRKHLGRLPPGTDLVVSARAEAGRVEFGELEAQFNRALGRWRNTRGRAASDETH